MSSPGRNTGFPFCTSTGPPPIPLAIPLQSGVNAIRRKRVVPAGASRCRIGTWFPRATSTPPPGGIGMLPPASCCETVVNRSVFGFVGGSDGITSATAFVSGGVVGPQADV
jgi:hypothetical protein